jgi:hypothetical protein
MQNSNMRKTLYFLVAMFLSMCTNAQTELLFNGENLEGWTVYGTEKWYVEDGLLICESGQDEQYGYLGTNKHYKNFIVELEFKQEADGNSGVFI